MKKLLFTLFIATSTFGYSQIEEIPKSKEYKNSIGIDYLFDQFDSPNIGVTYRRFFKDSKFNFRGNFTLGVEPINSKNANNLAFPEFASNALIFSTGDSSMPIISASESVYHSASYQRIELGIERQSTLWGLQLITGAGLTIGHRKSENYGRVNEVEIFEIERNGIKYNQYGAKDADSTFPYEDLNYLKSTYNYLTLGLNLTAGIKVDILPRLYATGFIGISMDGEFLLNESFDYKNDLFKEHLPSKSRGSFYNFNTSASIGLNYRF